MECFSGLCPGTKVLTVDGGAQRQLEVYGAIGLGRDSNEVLGNGVCG